MDGSRLPWEAKLAEFAFTEVCIVRQKIFVKLRRLQPQAGQHIVDLAAVVDLMDEEMAQYDVDRILADIAVQVGPPSDNLKVRWR